MEAPSVSYRDTVAAEGDGERKELIRLPDMMTAVCVCAGVTGRSPD